MKTRPSKTKISLWNFIPITHSAMCHICHYQKGLICGAKVIKGPEAIVDLHWAVYRFHGNSFLFRFFIDGIIFRVLDNRVFFESSVIESSSGSAAICSSLGSSMLFFIFLSNRATIFFIKNRCFSCIYYISLKCFNNFNKTDSEKINEEILTW